KLQEVFSKSQEAIHSGEINEVDNSRFNEEKAEAERKNKERKNRGEDPFLQAKRTQAINEITQAIEQEPKIPGNYLELADKN
ncbi:13753_t:CDS:2, partial [Racocetra persica]